MPANKNAVTRYYILDKLLAKHGRELTCMVQLEVPREELKRYSIWNLIQQVEANERYRVSVRDCSMGKGYPVSMVIITDIQNGTFGAKIGCHPSFAISVERTLTEALQGKRVQIFTAMNAIGTPGQVESCLFSTEISDSPERIQALKRLIV